MALKRWTVEIQALANFRPPARRIESPDGEFVLFADHEAELQRLRTANEKLVKGLERSNDVLGVLRETVLEHGGSEMPKLVNMMAANIILLEEAES